MKKKRKEEEEEEERRRRGKKKKRKRKKKKKKKKKTHLKDGFDHRTEICQGASGRLIGPGTRAYKINVWLLTAPNAAAVVAASYATRRPG